MVRMLDDTTIGTLTLDRGRVGAQPAAAVTPARRNRLPPARGAASPPRTPRRRFLGCDRLTADSIEWLKLHPAAYRAIHSTYNFTEHDPHAAGFAPLQRPTNPSVPVAVVRFDGCLAGVGYLCLLPVSAAARVDLPVYSTPLNDTRAMAPGSVEYARVGTIDAARAKAFFVTHEAGEWWSCQWQAAASAGLSAQRNHAHVSSYHPPVTPGVNVRVCVRVCVCRGVAEAVPHHPAAAVRRWLVSVV